jgi:F-type H+-transporting ATPase subunit epsilon
MNDFRFIIRTPEASVFDGQIEALVVPGRHGSFGVMAHHAPLLGALTAGIVKVTAAADELYFVIGDGLIEIADNEATLLTSLALKAHDPLDAEEKLDKLPQTLPQQPWLGSR